MAEDKIKLGLDLGDSSEQARDLASSLTEVRDAAQGVKDAATPLDDTLAMLDAGLVGLVPDAEAATAKTTAFAESLQRLDAVLRKVDDIETVFGPGVSDPRAAAQTYEVLADAAMRTRSQNKDLAESTKEVAKSYQLLAGAGSNFARLQEVEAASDKAVAAAVAQTRAQAALREVLSDIPPAFTRTIGVVKESGAAMAGAAKSHNQFGHSVLTTSYAVQDFTSVLGTQGLAGSLRAVQNNIPTLITQLGAGAGLAGVVGIVTVGTGLLYENWDSLVGLWSSTESKLPTLKEGLDGLAGSLKGISKEIDDLKSKAETDVLSDPEQNRLKDLERLQAQGQKQLDDTKLVEGIKAKVSDLQKAQIEAVKKALAEAGGGEAVADALRFQTGGEYKDAVETVASAARGNTDDIKKLREALSSFDQAFAKFDPRGLAVFKERMEPAAKTVRDFFDKFREETQKQVERYNAEMDRWIESTAEKLRSFNDRMRQEIEDAEWAEDGDRNAGAKDIIRDVESRDFSRTTVDRFGREKEVAGLGLTSKQVDDAANAAREFQRSAREQGGGLGDREAAQMAIQEQIVKNQQQMSDNWNTTNERMNRVLREARTVPSLLQFGMGQ